MSLNAAVDVTYVVDGLEPGREHAVREVARFAGGKANNVARVAAALGHQVIATGFAGGPNGRFIEEALRSQGVAAEFVPMAGENRNAVTIIDRTGRSSTLLREPGPQLTAADAERFLQQFRRLIRRVDFAVISGALPPGIPDDFYGELVSTAYRVAQVRCVVDACGDALRGVVPAQPYMVKPNLDELSEWAGRRLKGDGEILAAAQALMEAGPLVVAVSLGPGGMLLVSPEGAWRAVPPEVVESNTVGSGDALVAGLMAGLLEGRSAEEILRMAVACGTANATTRGVAEVDLNTVASLARQVRVERLSS
ncbi:MAG: 1-phosphofructokinase family hexose kinase [Bacillota bacterium]